MTLKTKIKTAVVRLHSIIIEPIKLALYPNKCICCGRLLPEGKTLCELCHHHIERVNLNKRCKVCGFEKQFCRCKYNVYHFEGVVAPFYNAGLAQKALYNYKLFLKKQYSRYFAAKMVQCVKRELSDREFDAVCYVPTAHNTIRYKGFDHAGLLAEQIGELLNIPVYSDVLFRKKGGRKQHTLSQKERYKNVRGRYGFNRRVDNKNILLVDDILTTGATLDECSRQLLFAGAESVYCVTALITAPNYKISDYAENLEFMLVDG